jgi:hypothetical protein
VRETPPLNWVILRPCRPAAGALFELVQWPPGAAHVARVPDATVLAGVEGGAAVEGDRMKVGVDVSLLIDTSDVRETPAAVAGHEDRDAAEHGAVGVGRVDAHDVVVVALAVVVLGRRIALEVVDLARPNDAQYLRGFVGSWWTL